MNIKMKQKKRFKRIVEYGKIDWGDMDIFAAIGGPLVFVCLLFMIGFGVIEMVSDKPSHIFLWGFVVGIVFLLVYLLTSLLTRRKEVYWEEQ